MNSTIFVNILFQLVSVPTKSRCKTNFLNINQCKMFEGHDSKTPIYQDKQVFGL